MTEYAVAIMLPPEHAALVLNARSTILDDGPPYTPHLTLKSPFAIDDDQSAVFDRIAAIACDQRPFAVRVRGLGSFHGPVMNVIFLRVDPTAELMAMHTAIVRGLSSTTHPSRPYGASLEMDNYVPHVTIAANLTEEQYQSGLATLSGEQPTFSFICTHITLGSSDDGKTWSLMADYPLGKAPPNVPHFVAHDTLGFVPD